MPFRLLNGSIYCASTHNLRMAKIGPRSFMGYVGCAPGKSDCMQ